VVAVSPDDDLAGELLRWLDKPYRKLLLLGKVPDRLRDRFGLKAVSWPEDGQGWAKSAPAATGNMAASPAEIRYTQLAHVMGAQAWRRPLERFDFTDEWNNLGYGAIREDGSIWALSEAIIASDDSCLAELVVAGESIASYCCL